MYFTRNLLFTICFTIPFLAPSLSLAKPKYETPLTLKASTVLEKEILKSSVHEVLPEVKNDGYLNHFSLTSPYGEFTAVGRPALERRVHEIHSIDVLRKEYPTSDVAGDAVIDTAEAVVKAPVRAVEKAYDTVTDTHKLGKTARSVPGGVVGLFGAAAKAVSDGATFVYDTGSSVVTGDGEGTSRQMDKAGETISSAAGSITGYSKAKRELSQQLKVDPYSDNKVLTDEIRRVAGIQSGIGVAGKLTPALVGVPYVGTINAYNRKAERVAVYDDPKKAEDLNEKIARTLKLSKDDPKGPYARFLSNSHYTPPFRGLLMNNLERMKGVKNIELFLEIASRARSRETAGMYVSASESLADYHEQEGRLEVLVSQVVVPAAVSKSGELVVPLPVDYLVWTKDVATIFKGFEERVKSYPVKRSEIRIAGTATPRVIEEFKRLGAEEIKQNVGYL